MIKLKSITFGFSENSMANSFLVGKSFKSFRDANLMIGKCAHTAPDTGGYDKTDFTLTFEDGEVYNGRLDMDRKMVGGYGILQKHVRSFLEFYAGKHRPAHLTQEQYDRVLGYHGPDQQAECKEWLANYDLALES